MRLRAWIWFCVSLFCFVAAFYFWRLGDKWAAQKGTAPPASPTNPGPAGQVPVKPSAQLGPVSVRLLSEPGQMAGASVPAPGASNRVSAVTLRLRNSSAPLGELMRSDKAVLLENALVDTGKPTELGIPEALRAQGDPGAYIVQAKGPIDDAFRSALNQAGAAIVAYIPNNAYLVRASEGVARQLEANAGTQAVLPYEPYYKLKPALLSLAVKQEPLLEETLLNVLVFPDAKESVISQLAGMGGEVVGEDHSPFGPVVQWRAGKGTSLDGVARLEGVHMVEAAPVRVLANDLSRVTVGVAQDSLTQSNYLGLGGTNVMVNVNDTGVDATHPDLENRVFSDLPVNRVDTNGHGTHVAAIIAGNGFKSTDVTNAVGSVNPGVLGQYRGKAPGAKVFAMGLNRPDFYLQENAARTNALVSANAWTYSASDYDLAAASYDAAVRDSIPGRTGSQPVVYVFPTGNQGSINDIGSSANDSGQGGVPGTVLSPGTAKNVITVGAVEQLRGITNATVQCLSGICNTNQPWFSSSDTSNQVAGFSGRGNVGIAIEGDFGRFKPDVVAPGTYVVSARSQQWDENAYYNPTNSSSQVLLSLLVSSNSTYSSGLFVPENSVGLVVAAQATTPIVDVDVSVSSPTGVKGTGVNQVSVSPPPEVGTFWTYTISNPTPQNVIFSVRTSLVTTNDRGNFLDVLKEMNDSLGKYYRYESGTSMAAADVAGTVALMEEFFQQRLKLTNSPALMKALLINGARSVSDAYSLQVNNPINYQGWGQVQLPNSLPGALSNLTTSAGASSIFVFDQSPTNALATGHTQTRFFSVSPAAQGQPLRVTLVWTDPPGDPAAAIKLVNDLDLVVTNLDSGETFFGNDIVAGTDFNLPWLTNKAPVIDVVNNVENVYLKQPLGTNYSVTVTGSRVNVNAVSGHTNDVVQDFALVVSSGDGQPEDALTLTTSKFQDVFVNAPFVEFLTNRFPTDPDNPITGGLLLHQHVGANTPLMGTNTIPLPTDANAQITAGMTNQWHFYVVSNEMNFTNASFVTFLPPELAVPRMGVTNVDNPDNATRPEADIDLYVTTDPGLTNLSPIAINGADKSVGRGGTEFIVKNDVAPGAVYYVGVKSEDQQAAEYSFLGVFSLFPPTETDTNGNRYLRGMPVPAVIPPGTPPNPRAALVIALDVLPTKLRRVVVTNTITHTLPGSLIGTLSHNRKFAVLNNHTCATDATGNCITNRHDYIYEDNGEGDIFGSRRSDGPGSLKEFVGEEGLGVWLLSMVNNFPSGTGVVNQLRIKLEKQNLDTNAVFRSLPPDTFTYDSIDVPADATNLTVCVAGNTATVDLYVSRDGLPTTTVFDYHLVVNAPGDCLPITIFDNPPLTPGRYFIGVYNSSTTVQDIRLTATVFRNPFAVSSSVSASAGPVTILDDAVTYAYLTNLNHMPIGALDIGLLINHPRISDLAITLVSPNGTRVLLFEDRGAWSTTGLGTFSSATNAQGAPSFGVTNMAPFYLNNFDDAAVGWYTPGATFGGWSVLSNAVAVYPELPAPWLSNNVLVLDHGGVSSWLPTTNSTSYQLSFEVTHAPYLAGTVGWWPFDGDAADIVGGHDGLLLGDVSFTFGAGEVNQALFGDRTATRMVVPGCPDLDVGQGRGFSIEGWLNPTNITTNLSQVITGATLVSDGFELAQSPQLGIPAGSTVSGWQVESGSVHLYRWPLNNTLPDSGTNYLDLNGFALGSVSRSFSTLPGRLYAVNFAYTKNPNTGNFSFVARANVDITGQPTWELDYGDANTSEAPNWFHTSVVFTASSTITKFQLTSLNAGGMYIDSFSVKELFHPDTSMPVVEWAGSSNGQPVGVQFWVSALPGSNTAPGSLWANVRDTNRQSHVVSTPALALTNAGWQHVALTFDRVSSVASIYVNGRLAIAQAFSPAGFVPLTSGDLYFGFHPGVATNFSAFAGGQDEFGLYDRALSDCEVAAIYQAGAGGKYGTNVLWCPVTNRVDLLTSLGPLSYTFVNGLTWNNGPQWETNTIAFSTALAAGSPSSNLTALVVSASDPNCTVDNFVLSGLVTNYLDGLLHFTEDTNLALVPIKFAPSPYITSNFPPTLIFSNDFESVVPGVYLPGAGLAGTTNDPAFGPRDWTVVSGPLTVLSNQLVGAQGTNVVALGGGGLQCVLPTAPAHRYQLNYSVRGPGAVSWWTGDVEPLSQRAWDVLAGNNGAFLHEAGSLPDGLVRAPSGTNALVFPGLVNVTNNLASKIEIGDPANLRLTNGFTIEGWIKPSVRPDATPETVEQILFRGDSRACLDPYWFAVERVTADQLDLVFHIEDEVHGGCGVALETQAQPIRAGVWQHVAAVFEPNVQWTNATWPTNELRLYVNGRQLTVGNNEVFLEDPSGFLATDFTGLFPFQQLDPGFSPGVSIGARSRADNSEPYYGEIDELTVYGRALTGPEIAAIAGSGAAGKADFRVPVPQSLAKVGVFLDNVLLDVGNGENSRWTSRSVTFTAYRTNVVLTLQSLLPGTIVDGITLVELPAELNYLPEESLSILNGEDAYGVWRLEIWDTRANAALTNTLATLLDWQLRFTLLPSNAPPVIHLAHGIPYTNTLTAHGVQNLVVDVPQWATNATNVLLFGADRLGISPLPLGVMWDPTNPAPTSVTAAIVWPPAPNGGSVLGGNTNVAPYLVPGSSYYLTVTNPNPVAAMYAYEVSFDLISLTNCQPLSNYVWQAGIPRYLQFDIPTNAVPPGAPPTEVAFWLTGAQSNLTVVLSQHLPLPDLTHYDYISQRPCTNDEVFVVLTNTTPFPLQSNRWYVGVFNSASTNVPFKVQMCYSAAISPVIIPLTNAVAFGAGPLSPYVAPPGPPRWFFFEFQVTNSVDAVLFEMFNMSGDADLVLQRDEPPGMAPYFDGSFRQGLEPEQIVLRTSLEFPDLRGNWYLGIYNNEVTNLTYTVRAVVQANGLLLSAQPIQAQLSPMAPQRGWLYSWNSVEGEAYLVEFTGSIVQPNWIPVSPVIAATTPLTTWEVPAPTGGSGFYRVRQVPISFIPHPELTIQVRTNNLVRISWPTYFPGHTLQWSYSFLGPWANVNRPVNIEGLEFVVYDTIEVQPKYYRLIP